MAAEQIAAYFILLSISKDAFLENHKPEAGGSALRIIIVATLSVIIPEGK